MRGVRLTNFISSTRATGSISLPAKEVTYREGQVLSGKVLASKNGKYLIQLGKNKILADSRFRLQVGDSFKVRVAGKVDGKLHLKLLTLDRKFIFREISKEEVMRQLLSLKMPLTDQAIEAAKVAIKYGIPLSRDALAKLMRVLGTDFSSSRAEAAAFLLATGLELTPGNLSALESLLNNSVALANYLALIITYYRKEVLPKDLQSDFKALIEELKKMIAQPGKVTGIRGSVLASTKGENLAAKMLHLANELSRYPAHEPLKNALEAVGELLRGANLVNSVNNLENALYVPIPVTMGGKPTTFELRIYYYYDESGERVIDPNKLKFDLSVETEKLGKIVYTVAVSHDNVGVTAKVDRNDIKELIEGKVSLLRDDLSKKGYKLNRWDVLLESVKRGLMKEYPMEGVDVVA